MIDRSPTWLFPGLVLLLCACAPLQQSLHTFPRPLAEQLAGERCDCERFEVVGDDAGYLTTGAGERRPFSYRKGVLKVDVENGFLSVLSSRPAFGEVEQRAIVHNPFDGADYLLEARYDGTAMVVLVRGDARQDGPLLGRLSDAMTGSVGGRRYRLAVQRRWEGGSERVAEAGGTVWHQYPPGAYLHILGAGGVQARLYQGAHATRPGGGEGRPLVYDGRQVAVLIPRTVPRARHGELFLFYFAHVFYEEFSDAIMGLTDCLEADEDERVALCPPRLLTY